MEQRRRWQLERRQQLVWTAAQGTNILLAPNGIDSIASFGIASFPGGNRTVTVDLPRTVGTMYFNYGSVYTIAGTNAVTLDVSSGQAAINDVSGSHVISAPLVLNDNTTITVGNSASIFTISGTINAAGRTITKAGNGRLDASPINAAGLTINAGTYKLLADPNPTGTSKVNALSIAGDTTPTAKLDLTNNALVVDYNSPDSSPFATVQARSSIAYNTARHAAATGKATGITSSPGERQPVRRRLRRALGAYDGAGDLRLG